MCFISELYAGTICTVCDELSCLADDCTYCTELRRLTKSTARARARRDYNIYNKKNVSYHYAVTLTAQLPSTDLLMKVVNYILKRQTFKIVGYILKWELTKGGIPHVHMYLLSAELFRSTWIRDILKKNNNNRVEVKRINGLAVNKWQNYCKKLITSEEEEYFKLNKIVPLIIEDGTAT